MEGMNSHHNVSSQKMTNSTTTIADTDSSDSSDNDAEDLRENDYSNPTITNRNSQSHYEKLAPWDSMSFACGGWLQFYLFGVAKAIQARGYDRGVKYLGCSAGSLAALGLAIQGDFDKAVNFCKDECIPQAYAGFSGLFKLDQYVAHCLDYHCGLDNWTELKPGDLHIAMTGLPFFTAERADTFTSKEDLRSSILASCAAFPAASIVYRRGGYYMDGGLTDFQPILDERTITVSPFYFSNCDIKPSRYVPFWWAAFPPQSAETIIWLYNLGFEDGSAFIDAKQLPDSPEARPHLTEVPRGEHHYDTRKRVTMHRFLGYDPQKLTNYYFIMDFLLLLFLAVLWKPLCILLIYIELLLKSIYSVLRIGISEFWCLIPCIAFAFIEFSIFSQLFVITSLIILCTNWSLHGPTETTIKNGQYLYDYLLCIFSLSLFLRFFSGVPSYVQLRKHNRLQRSSLIYRIFHHIM